MSWDFETGPMNSSPGESGGRPVTEMSDLPAPGVV